MIGQSVTRITERYAKHQPDNLGMQHGEYYANARPKLAKREFIRG